MTLPRRGVGVVAAAVTAGLLAVLAVTQLHGGEGVGSLALVLGFSVAVAANWSMPLVLPWKDDAEAVQLDEGFLVAMLFVLPPVGVLLAFGLGVLGGLVVRRRPVVKTVFNIGQAMAAVGVALLLVSAMAPGPLLDPDLLGVAAGVVAAIAYFSVNAAWVSGIIAVTQDQPFRNVFTRRLGVRLLAWSGCVALGLLAGATAVQTLWLLGAAVVIALLFHFNLVGHVRARRDRERVNGLFLAAVQAHAPTDIGEVETAIVDSVKALLRCRMARLGPVPPADGEMGVPLDCRTDLGAWLVAANPEAPEPFDEADRRLLEAVAAIGSAAIDKTSLLEQVRRQAFHDTLTDLPNQLLFDDRVAQALAQSDRHGDGVAVLFLDLDHFKKVNDSLGHAAGNELLMEVARRLSAAVRLGDTVARMGGDEFTILLPRVHRPDDAIAVAEGLCKTLAETPMEVDGRTLVISASVGVAVAPGAGVTADELLKNADAAMYRAKARGRGRCQVYASDMNASGSARLALEADLHRALRGDELRLVYQPVVDLDADRIVGLEALIRWQHPDLGLLSPDAFVPIAEQSGLIGDLDHWVLVEACRMGAELAAAGHTGLRLAVNVSGANLHDGKLDEIVVATLADTGFDARCLEIEVTESVAIHEDDVAVSMLGRLQAAGVHVVIDDFGVGYSVLGRLRHFPVDKVKIDRSFVTDMMGAEGSSLVAAIIGMGHSLNLKVVAEGVETTEQRQVLSTFGCDLAQGYLFSRPVGAEELLQVLSRQAAQASGTALRS